MTFEAPVIDGAILRRISELLSDALAQAGKVLQGAGASPEEMLRATEPFIPLLKLLQGQLYIAGAAAPPTRPVRTDVPTSSEPAGLEGPALSPEQAEKIERDFVERWSNVIPLVRR